MWRCDHVKEMDIRSSQSGLGIHTKRVRIGMKKTESYRQALNFLLDDYLRTGDIEKIWKYLASNSNLPGPRGNLELAEMFVEAVEEHYAGSSEKMWSLCQELTKLSPERAPTNSSMEFLPFCGTWAMGAIGSTSRALLEKVMPRLREMAADPRWRTREAVAMGIQKAIVEQGSNVLEKLENWISDDDWLAMRAVAAGVAEPAVLRDERIAIQALELHRKIFARIVEFRERRTPEFKILRQGLGYSLSVVVRAVPKRGFRYMRQLADSKDVDILWILRENLKKSRLVKNFPHEVDSIEKLLK